MHSGKLLPIMTVVDVCLTEGTAAFSPNEFNVTALPADFHETGRFKPALGLAKGQRAKPSQPLAGGSLAEVQSAAPALPSNWREPLLRSRLDWRASQGASEEE